MVGNWGDVSALWGGKGREGGKVGVRLFFRELVDNVYRCVNASIDG